MVHSLRVAIEHAYVAVVKPMVTDESARKKIKFPSSRIPDEFPHRCKVCLAYRVSNEFAEAIISLRPHGGPDGDRELYLICQMNNEAKHQGLVPIGYYTSWTVGKLRKQIPDLLPGLDDSSSFGFGQNGVDASWPGRPFSINERIVKKVPLDGRLRREILVKIDIGFVAEVDEQ